MPNPFDQFDGGTTTATAEPPDPRRAAKGRALRGEQVAERRSGYGADALMAGADALGYVGDTLSKANPITLIPRLAWNVNELGKPPEQQQPFPLDGSTPIVAIPRFTTEQARDWLRTSGVSDERMAGIANAGIDFAEFFTTPTGINTLLSGKLGPEVAKRALAMGFTAEMAQAAPEAATQAGELVGSGDVSEGTRASLGAAAQIILPAAIVGGHAKFPRVPTPGERAGRMLQEAADNPATIARLEQTAQELALERTQPDRGLRVERPDGPAYVVNQQTGGTEFGPVNPFDRFDQVKKAELHPEQLSEEAPTLNKPRTVRETPDPSAYPEPLEGQPYEVESLRDKMARIQQAKSKKVADVLANAGDEGAVELVSIDRPGTKLLVTPDPAELGKWRVTRVDEQGPVAHNVFDNRDSAVRAAAGESNTPAVKGPPYYGAGEFKVARVRQLPTDRTTPDPSPFPSPLEGQPYETQDAKPKTPDPLAPAAEPAATTAFDPSAVQTVEFPIAKLKLSKDVPNFKGGASEDTGTVAGQELAGKYQRTGTAPIVVWERLNGDTEVITGRHRFDLARRTGEKTIPAQVVREADGFTKDQALTFDAEANIRDGQGEVADYATYFKGIAITEAEARTRGLLSRAKGNAGWSLAKAATDDVYALWRADKLTDAQAVAIARAAPGDAGAQQIGSKFALQGKGPDFLTNVIKASKAEAGQRAESLDLFGKDDSAMKTMAEQAERASQFQKDIVEQIRAVQGAAKRPEVARELGVDVRDPEGVVKRIGELKAELVRWADWPLQPDLVAKVKGEEIGSQPFEQTMFRGDTRETPLTPEKAKGGIHFSSDKGYAETFTQVGMAQDSGIPIVAARVKLANPLDLRRFAKGTPFTIAELKQSLSEQGVPLSLELSLRTPGMESDGIKTLGQWISSWGPDSERIDDFSPNESLTDYIGGAIKKLGKHDGILFQEHGLDITSAVVFSSKSLNQNATGGPKAASAGIKTPSGSPEAGKGSVSALQTEGASALTSPTQSGSPSAVKAAFSLAPAESVAQQTARLAKEQAGREAKAQQDKLAELQAKPLAGTTGDLGQGDMFAGPQDLFAPPSPKAVEAKPVPALPTGLAELVAEGEAAGQMVRVLTQTRGAGAAEPYALPPDKASKLAEAKALANKNGWDWSEVERQANEQLKGQPEHERRLQLVAMFNRELTGAEDIRRRSGPEIIGMGGAVPSEFRGGSVTPTGIKNATVDRERAQRGLPPAMEAARRDWGSVWDEAMARVDTDPGTVDRLIAELKEKPRALTDTEDALLLHRQIDLQNEYGRATRELAVAYEDSKSFPNRLADVEALKVRTAEISDQLLDLYNVNKAAGTETGRGLAARKMMANEDFTLAAMEMEKRAALGGAPLTDAERAAMTKLQERITELERAAVAREEQVAAERAGRMTDEAIADMKRELASKPSYDPRIVKIAEEIVSKLEKQAEKSRAFLKGKFLSPTPEDIYHLGVIGAAKIARLGLDFSKFSIEMAAEFGDGVKPYLQAAWDRANLHLENEGAKYGDKAEPVKRLLRKRDAEGQREGVIEGLKKGVEEGLPVGLLGDYVRKLALSFVRGGVTERNALVDAVHKVLTEDIGMELSRRETMDAISGYGRFKPLDADAAKAQLRDLKGQMQQVAKLEDITAKKPLQKTGLERRTQSDEERRLIQQVNEAKRRFGVVVTDPARQLKSALDAVRTRLKHQVADLEYQIATKERIVKSKTDAPFDAETKLLETRRDALRAQLDELVPKPGRTDAQLLELAMRNTERSIADYEARIAGGEMLVKRAKPTITSPELAALKARRDAVRAEWQELRELDGEFQRQKAEQALTRQKSALEESIAAKEKQLAEGPKPPAGREVARPADPALEELMQKRDALNRQLAEARKKPWEQKHAENVARRLAAMEESIAEREAKLAAGDLSTESRAKVARPMADPALEQARQKLDDVNRRLAEARKPKLTPEERALKALHTRLTTSAAEYADRLARGDFAPRVRKPVPTDPTTLRLKAKAEQAKAEWNEGLQRDRFRQLSPTKKAFEHAKEILNVPRAVLASWDVSAVLRQGGFITLNPMNWRRAASGLAPMFRALASETRAHMVDKEIHARPNAPLYDRAQLFLAPLETSKLTAMEEIYMSRLSRVMPGVRASERAYITFLNKLRADSFDALVDRLQAKGTPLTDLELQAVGNFINVSTGRGNMGSHAAAAETLATVFFSPRLVLSRFQLVTGQPLRKAGSARVARAVAAEYAGFLGGLAVVYALANMAGAEIETDPRSSDFGKLRFGNTRVDPLAGLAQVSVLLSRLSTGKTKTMAGKVVPIVGDLPYGADTVPDVILKFLRTKLSPIVGAAIDIRQGENVIGEKKTPVETLERLAMPLSFEDIYKVMLEDGIPKGTALGILSLFGWGLQQHDEPKPKK